MADMYNHAGKFQDAMTQYRIALKLCHDRDPEIEGLCHFKIGRLIMQSPNPDLEKARNHIVDF